MGSGPEARRVVEALFAAFSARDVDGAVALLDPSFELWPQPTAERAGRTEPYRGHEGWRAYMADVERVWEHFEVRATDVRAAGAAVICFGRAVGRARDGAAVDVPLIWVLRLRGGRLASCRIAQTAGEALELARA